MKSQCHKKRPQDGESLSAGNLAGKAIPIKFDQMAQSFLFCLLTSGFCFLTIIFRAFLISCFRGEKKFFHKIQRNHN